MRLKARNQIILAIGLPPAWGRGLLAHGAPAEAGRHWKPWGRAWGEVGGGGGAELGGCAAGYVVCIHMRVRNIHPGCIVSLAMIAGAWVWISRHLLAASAPWQRWSEELSCARPAAERWQCGPTCIIYIHHTLVTNAFTEEICGYKANIYTPVQAISSQSVSSHPLYYCSSSSSDGYVRILTVLNRNTMCNV